MNYKRYVATTLDKHYIQTQERQTLSSSMAHTAHLRFARAYAAEKLPWFAPALFRCRIILSEAVDVAAIDLHYNIYWNPAVVDDIWNSRERPVALAELAFLWIHEISHRLRKHAERAKAFNIYGKEAGRLWNVAADFEINDTEWPGMRMPAAYPGMLPEDFGYQRGQLAETYFQGISQSHPNLAASHDDGSGAHHQERDWENGNERQNISSLDDQVLRREIARRMKEAGNKATPGGWRNWAEEVIHPKTNWRARLGNRMSVALQNGIGSRIDYSFSRPSRRQSVYHPILTPSLRGDRTARIAVVVDTSGSMDAELLSRALAEVASVLRTFQYPVTIIPCDNTAYGPVKVLASQEAYRLQSLPGGGGTDMTAGILAALDLTPAPDSILVLTDGFTRYPTRRFNTPVIFGIFDLDEGKRRRPPNPPWGEDAVVAITE
ncbi:MAG: putative metal-dependent peptidase [Neolewinella sp.]